MSEVDFLFSAAHIQYFIINMAIILQLKQIDMCFMKSFSYIWNSIKQLVVCELIESTIK